MQECHECSKFPRLDNGSVYSAMNPPENEDASPPEPASVNGRLHNPDESPPAISPDDNSAHNDCSKKCSTSAEEVRTKVQHFNNLTNRSDDAAKVNNNAGSRRTCHRFQNGASTSRSGQDESVELDGCMWNNVDSPCDVDKCPSKVRNGSIDGSGRRKCRRARCSEDDDSSSGNEGEEECCVYTYKGSLQADLPNSFFTLDRLANGLDNPADDLAREPLLDNNRSQAGSSPDNEFLEMDFDPGPSLDLDMEESELEQDGRVSPVPELPSEQAEENDLSAENQNAESAEYLNNVSDWYEDPEEPRPGPSTASPPAPTQRAALTLPTTSYVGTTSVAQRNWSARDSGGHHCSSGDLCSPWDASEMEGGETLALWNASHNMRVDSESTLDTRKYNLFSDLYHSIMAKRLVMEKNASFTDVSKGDGDDGSPEERDTPPVDRTMIWSEQEACNKQVTQISTSACGATAVINVMMALNAPFSVEKLKKGVGTRLRQESAPLPQYLASRACAGATHEDVIRGVAAASEGWLYARFFHMHPERRLSLSKWLSYWMRKGAVPVATLNLQAGLPPGASIPDAWHHQMVFGVSPRGVFLTNPLECVPEGALFPQLCSPSVLKVKRSDILQRWTSATDLTPLMCQTDVRWKQMNVLGQIVNMVRESAAGSAQGRAVTHHVTIPAAYKSGITLAIPRDSPGYEELVSLSELPLLQP